MLSTTRRFSSDSSTPSDLSPKRRRLRSPEHLDSRPPIKIYIVQAKLTVQAVDELYSLIDTTTDSSHPTNTSHKLKLELCADASRAHVIIANVTMRKRLERHIDWKLAQQKAIVTPQWLRDSVRENYPLPYGGYAALREVHDSTKDNYPNYKDPEAEPPPGGLTQRSGMPRALYTSDKVKDNYRSRFACARASPLVCPNQALLTEIGVLHRSRELEGKSINALSYERAIAVLKAYPYIVTLQNFKSDISNLPFLGDKILSKIKEYLHKGTIEESQTIRMSERFQALSAFTTVYGVGAKTARDLFDIGLRTIEDMERYYDIDTEDLGDNTIFTPNGKRLSRNGDPPGLSIKAALALRNDLQEKISRTEVEEMHGFVMAELEIIKRGCISTIVGGYRRGKLESNDVDIVISHSDLRSGVDEVKNLCARLVQQLYNRGLVTHVMHLSGFHVHDPLRTSHWDSLEKALTIFRLPADGSLNRRINRRLDLIFTSSEAYWTAVVGWTGSRMFERDLRLWAKTEKGMKFDSSGISRRHDSKVFNPASEREVFVLLGLEWIDPTLRNANL